MGILKCNIWLGIFERTLLRYVTVPDATHLATSGRATFLITYMNSYENGARPAPR